VRFLLSYAKNCRVEHGASIKLDKVDADFRPKGLDRDEAEERFRVLTNELRDLQHLMYAEDRRSLLVVLQGRDAAGKDGTIRHVFGPMNPQGTRVTSFKVVRVHDLVPKIIWSKRFDHINAFERLLADNGTVILKFYLHIDREEQLERFKKRMDNPKKNWKISDADYSERPHWDAYTEAFEDALSKCSTDIAPWFIIPSNRKWARNLIIADIVADAMKGLDMRFPEPEVDMDEIRRKYHEAERSG